MKTSVKLLVEVIEEIDSLESRLDILKKKKKSLCQKMAEIQEPTTKGNETVKQPSQKAMLKGRNKSVRVSWVHYPSTLRPATMSTAHWRMRTTVVEN